jgi:hypothetical protein
MHVAPQINYSLTFYKEFSMNSKYLPRSSERRIPQTFSPVTITLCLLLAIASGLVGCERDVANVGPSSLLPPGSVFETTGEEFLLSALAEIDSITAFAFRSGIVPKDTANLHGLFSALPTKDHKQVISAVDADTTYVYGQTTLDGYGAVVTERHAYPKGILLITIRKTYGKDAGHMVTSTSRYISDEDFRNDNPQQSNVTEVYGLSSDTIVTYVMKNGTTETYTFRLPVITSVTNPQDGSVRVTSRYGQNGFVYSVVRDGFGNLIQLRRSHGEDDGAIISYVQYADGSWRSSRVLGQSDGAVFHDVTSGP